MLHLLKSLVAGAFLSSITGGRLAGRRPPMSNAPIISKLPTVPQLSDVQQHGHILCEEGSCVNEKCTSVFDNKLDYQAHCVKARTAQGKNASRQQSQLDPGILFTQPSGLVQASYERGGGGGRDRGARRNHPVPPPRNTEEDDNRGVDGKQLVFTDCKRPAATLRQESSPGLSANGEIRQTPVAAATRG